MVAIFAAAIAVAPSAGAADGPRDGGDLTLIHPDPATFNPLQQSALNTFGPVLFQVYDALAVEDGKTSAVKPRLLKSITSSSDASVWTLTLRPDVKFTDGTPFDSAAIKFAFDYAADPANKSGGLATAQSVASWDVSDPLVAKATLKAPDVTFSRSLVGRLSMIPSPTAVQKFGASYGTSPDTTVGAGPFTMSTWVKGSSLTFDKNPNYWQKSQPYLDSVTVKAIVDPSLAYSTLATGGGDILKLPTLEVYNQAKASGGAVKVLPGYSPNASTMVSNRSFWEFNLTKPPFNDLLARQAVYAALNPQAYAAAIGMPARTSIFEKGSFWYTKDGNYPKYDPKKAQKLIDEWSAKNGGEPLEFNIMQSAGLISLGGDAKAVQAALSGYDNLKVNVDEVPPAQVPVKAAAGDFDLFPNAIGGSDPDAAFQPVLSTSPRNFGKYNNPEVDAAYLASKGATTPAKRKAYYDKIQKAAMTDLPEWFMPSDVYRPESYFGVSNKNLQNVQIAAYMGLDTAAVWIKN